MLKGNNVKYTHGTLGREDNTQHKLPYIDDNDDIDNNNDDNIGK